MENIYFIFSLHVMARHPGGNFGHLEILVKNCLLLLLRIRFAHLLMVRESRLCQGRCLLVQNYFVTVYDYAGEADLSEGY